MKILETAVLSQNPQFFNELKARLPLEKENLFDIDIYRFEVDDDLIVLLYDLELGKKIPQEILDHLVSHLSGLLLLTDAQSFDAQSFSSSLMNEFTKSLEDKPTVVAVRKETTDHINLDTIIKKSGFYLSPRGRLMFWSPQSAESQRNIWSSLWNVLQAEA